MPIPYDLAGVQTAPMEPSYITEDEREYIDRVIGARKYFDENGRLCGHHPSLKVMNQRLLFAESIKLPNRTPVYPEPSLSYEIEPENSTVEHTTLVTPVLDSLTSMNSDFHEEPLDSAHLNLTMSLESPPDMD